MAASIPHLPLLVPPLVAFPGGGSVAMEQTLLRRDDFQEIFRRMHGIPPVGEAARGEGRAATRSTTARQPDAF